MSAFENVSWALTQGETICFIAPDRLDVIYSIPPERIEEYVIPLSYILYADWFIKGDR